MTSGMGSHNNNCANAVGHVCRCAGCGGSLHGWEGWVNLSNTAEDERQNRRQQVEAEWERYYRPERKRSNEKSRIASTDLARLDIVDWLARQLSLIPGQRAAPRAQGSSFQSEREPHSATSGVKKKPESKDQPIRFPGDAPQSSHVLQPGQAKPGDRPENRSRPEPQSGRSERGESENVSTALPVSGQPDDHMRRAREALPVPTKPGDGPKDHSRAEPQPERSERRQPDDIPPYLSVVEQVEILAKAMTGTWAEIAAELGDTKSAKDTKRQLAYHGWCDLFIGLVQVIEIYQHTLDKIPDAAKDLVKQAILRSSMQAKRSHVTSVVVDVVVDKVWQAFKGALVGQVPLLSFITGEEALRSLRILAVFTCPAPEKHKEVREHALRPLGDDARKILTAQTKTRLAKLFDEWATDGDKSTSVDLARIESSDVVTGSSGP